MPTKLPITEEDYTAYFKAEAERLFGEAGHFWEIADTDNLTDLKQALGRDLQLPALVLRPFTEGFDTTNDQLRSTWSGTFTILFQTGPTDFATWAGVRRQARQQGLRVIARLRKEERMLPRQPGWLYQRGVTLGKEFPGSDEPLINQVATGYSFEFDWQVPQPLPAE